MLSILQALAHTMDPELAYNVLAHNGHTKDSGRLLPCLGKWLLASVCFTIHLQLQLNRHSLCDPGILWLTGAEDAALSWIRPSWAHLDQYCLPRLAEKGSRGSHQATLFQTTFTWSCLAGPSAGQAGALPPSYSVAFPLKSLIALGVHDYNTHPYCMRFSLPRPTQHPTQSLDSNQKHHCKVSGYLRPCHHPMERMEVEPRAF